MAVKAVLEHEDPDLEFIFEEHPRNKAGSGYRGVLIYRPEAFVTSWRVIGYIPYDQSGPQVNPLLRTGGTAPKKYTLADGQRMYVDLANTQEGGEYCKIENLVAYNRLIEDIKSLKLRLGLLDKTIEKKGNIAQTLVLRNEITEALKQRNEKLLPLSERAIYEIIPDSVLTVLDEKHKARQADVDRLREEKNVELAAATAENKKRRALEVGAASANLPDIPEGYIRLVHFVRGSADPKMNLDEKAKEHFAQGLKFRNTLNEAAYYFMTNERVAERLVDSRKAFFVPRQLRNCMAMIMDIPKSRILVEESYKALPVNQPDQSTTQAERLYQYTLPKEYMVGAIKPNNEFIANPDYSMDKVAQANERIRRHIAAFNASGPGAGRGISGTSSPPRSHRP